MTPEQPHECVPLPQAVGYLPGLPVLILSRCRYGKESWSLAPQADCPQMLCDFLDTAPTVELRIRERERC